MKKRLRKKLKVGEFKQIGLNITVNLSKDLDISDRFYDNFLDILEENSFLFFGLCESNKIDGYMYESRFRQNTTKNIKNIETLLIKNPFVDSIEFGEKGDAWN